MKKIIPIACIFLALAAYAKADIQVTDNAETNLYELVNNYFGLEKAEQYGSSQQMYSGGTEKVTWTESRDVWKPNRKGGGKWTTVSEKESANVYQDGLGVVNPNTTWTTTENTSILGVYRQASAEHDLSIKNGDASVGYWDDIAGYEKLEQFSSNDIPMWSSNKAGEEIYFELDTLFSYQNSKGKSVTTDTTWSSNTGDNSDGMTHMIAFDVTGLYNEYRLDQGEEAYESVYLFGWEDLYEFNGADWDYNDVVFLMANISPNNPFEQPTDEFPPDMPTDDIAPPPFNSTPEPATLAILGLGLAGLGLARRRRK